MNKVSQVVLFALISVISSSNIEACFGNKTYWSISENTVCRSNVSAFYPFQEKQRVVVIEEKDRSRDVFFGILSVTAVVGAVTVGVVYSDKISLYSKQVFDWSKGILKNLSFKIPEISKKFWNNFRTYSARFFESIANFARPSEKVMDS